MTVQSVDNIDELIAVWPEINKGLKIILSKCSDECTWTPRDVFNSIYSNNALLIVGHENGIFQGFAVITFERDHDGLDGHIWVAYNAGQKDYLESAWTDIISICKEAGCKRITMASNQKGWLRLGKKLGFRPVTTTYKVDI